MLYHHTLLYVLYKPDFHSSSKQIPGVWIIFGVIMFRETTITILFCYPDCRWYPWPVLRPSSPVRIRRLPARIKLPLSRRLRGPRQTVARDHLPPSRLQNQISRKLFPSTRKPWVRQHQQNIRILWWMWVSHSTLYPKPKTTLASVKLAYKLSLDRAHTFE